MHSEASPVFLNRPWLPGLTHMPNNRRAYLCWFLAEVCGCGHAASRILASTRSGWLCVCSPCWPRYFHCCGGSLKPHAETYRFEQSDDGFELVMGPAMRHASRIRSHVAALCHTWLLAPRRPAPRGRPEECAAVVTRAEGANQSLREVALHRAATPSGPSQSRYSSAPFDGLPRQGRESRMP